MNLFLKSKSIGILYSPLASCSIIISMAKLALAIILYKSPHIQEGISVLGVALKFMQSYIPCWSPGLSPPLTASSDIILPTAHNVTTFILHACTSYAAITASYALPASTK